MYSTMPDGQYSICYHAGNVTILIMKTIEVMSHLIEKWENNEKTMQHKNIGFVGVDTR